LGRFLQLQVRLEAFPLYPFSKGAPGLYFHLQAVPPNVRQYWYRHGQRAPKQGESMGALARSTVPPVVHGQTDA
jgi:hypothetical protein